VTIEMPAARNLIFISHSTPEDNDFALWLGARLASAGYAVWSDVTNLIGGEIHWDSIEEAIREHAIKLISVCSTASVGKKGFKDELSLALAVEQQHDFTNFVIPIRLGDLAYSSFPAEIIRRNGINFSQAWQDGVGKLIKRLELDDVPRSSAIDADALSSWAKSLLQIDSDVIASDETLVGNTLSVLQSPSFINIHQLKAGASLPAEGMLAWPAESTAQSTCSFANFEGRDPGCLEYFSQVDLAYFLENGYERLSVGRQDAYNITSSILRQAWGRYVQSKGLQGQGFANGRVGYFLPAEDGGGKRISFKGETGVAGSRALNGFSAKNKVYWHYAPELLPILGKPMSYSVVPHVIFTEDGKTPISDSARAHRLRRRFCKSWWQDRWRDLMLAYLAHFAGGKDTIEVPLSESLNLILSVHPTLFVCPVTAAAPIADPEDNEADDPLVDECDDDSDSEVLEIDEVEEDPG